MSLRAILAAAVLLCGAQSALAQSLTLEFNEGRVSLAAQNVPLRAILAEWARLGGATIVNGNAVTGPPVTLELENVPERQALDILLRGVSGYMLAVRPTGAVGLAAFDRIMILPTSTPPRNVPPPPAFQPRPLAQPRPAVDADQPSEPVDAPPSPEESPAEARPNTGVREVPVIPRPFDGVPQGEAPAAPPATPGNPFGMPFGTTSRPGVITPVPQQPGPNARPNQEP